MSKDDRDEISRRRFVALMGTAAAVALTPIPVMGKLAASDPAATVREGYAVLAQQLDTAWLNWEQAVVDTAPHFDQMRAIAVTARNGAWLDETAAKSFEDFNGACWGIWSNYRRALFMPPTNDAEAAIKARAGADRLRMQQNEGFGIMAEVIASLVPPRDRALEPFRAAIRSKLITGT